VPLSRNRRDTRVSKLRLIAYAETPWKSWRLHHNQVVSCAAIVRIWTSWGTGAACACSGLRSALRWLVGRCRRYHSFDRMRRFALPHQHFAGRGAHRSRSDANLESSVVGTPENISAGSSALTAVRLMPSSATGPSGFVATQTKSATSGRGCDRSTT